MIEPKPLATIVIADHNKFYGMQLILQFQDLVIDLGFPRTHLFLTLSPCRVLMSRRLLAAALRPNQNRMGTALGQAVLRMHQRGMTKGKEDEEFYRLIRVQEEVQCISLMSSFNIM